MINRYENKPLLRLLELYVIKAIGELSEMESARLAAMQPNLAKTFKHDGEWDEIIEKTMNFPSNMPMHILAVWEKNRNIKSAIFGDLSAQKFAEEFVDSNFL